ncbi:MAG: hypothetical protein PHI63_06605, partial [Patescibacteria group bacterium]|nr:hypothetical protein [Patescibacteria group bacterium]
AHIYLPQGGAYIRDGGLRIVNFGQSTRDETPDPVPETEDAMRNHTGLSDEASASDRELNSFVVGADIDSVAQAIEVCKGVVFGVIGSNDGWRTQMVRPPIAGETTWGHALYLCGRHLHDGMRCVVARSSWAFTPVHHIREDYFAGGVFVFNPWTLIPKPAQNMEFIKNHQNWLVRNSDTGAFGLVVGDALLITSQERAGLFAVTLIERKVTQSINIPTLLWNALPNRPF